MSKKILVVDDEKMLTEILSEYFGKEKGHTVFMAEDGEAAQQIIEKESLDLVLLDMKLPKVDGIEILKLLREEYPQTKVIVMTCYDVEYKKKIDHIGFDGFFMKPLSMNELQEAVKNCLSESPAEKPKQETYEKEGVIPKARLLIIEPKRYVAALLEDVFKDKNLSAGNYVVKNTYSQNINTISEFKPDIVLYDIASIGIFSEFATNIMKFENPPKEIILYGEPSLKWEEVDALVERGMKYVQTPFDPEIKKKGPDFELPSRETVQKLCLTVRNMCFKHGLCAEEGKED